MVVYPLSLGEDLAIRWVARIVPASAITLILLLGAMSVAAAPT